VPSGMIRGTSCLHSLQPLQLVHLTTLRLMWGSSLRCLTPLCTVHCSNPTDEDLSLTPQGRTTWKSEHLLCTPTEI
jgi:hypothetical protein